MFFHSFSLLALQIILRNILIIFKNFKFYILLFKKKKILIQIYEKNNLNTLFYILYFILYKLLI